MLPAFLITFREVIEATLIVATVLGILVKLKQFTSIKTVWWGTMTAAFTSMALLGVGSLFGLKIHELYTGRAEKIFEGVTMLTSAFFITWAVFWLHNYFGRYKLTLLQKVKKTVVEEKQRGLFLLVFTAVFREGFEIVLFLTTIYLSANPVSVFTGFGLGTITALLVSTSLFTASLKLPVFRAFQATTVLLVLFAAGLAGRGMHEFIEAGIISEYLKVTISFLPETGHLAGDLIKSVFGWSKTMDYLQLAVYAGYLSVMRWYLFGKKSAIRVVKN